MQIWHYDLDSGLLLGEGTADPSPLEPGVWLIPAHATTAAPPDPVADKNTIWDGAAWTLRDRPVPPEPHAPVPEPPPAVPSTISFRQLILGLLGGGFITAEQALAAAETRARPPQLDAIIATLPEDAALAARITWATMIEARRDDPLFAALVASGHAAEKQVDELFKASARL
jgi:hypothetical protein